MMQNSKPQKQNMQGSKAAAQEQLTECGKKLGDGKGDVGLLHGR